MSPSVGRTFGYEPDALLDTALPAIVEPDEHQRLQRSSRRSRPSRPASR